MSQDSSYGDDNSNLQDQDPLAIETKVMINLLPITDSELYMKIRMAYVLFKDRFMNVYLNNMNYIFH